MQKSYTEFVFLTYHKCTHIQYYKYKSYNEWLGTFFLFVNTAKGCFFFQFRTSFNKTEISYKHWVCISLFQLLAFHQILQETWVTGEANSLPRLSKLLVNEFTESTANDSALLYVHTHNCWSKFNNMCDRAPNFSGCLEWQAWKMNHQLVSVFLPSEYCTHWDLGTDQTILIWI